MEAYEIANDAAKAQQRKVNLIQIKDAKELPPKASYLLKSSHRTKSLQPHSQFMRAGTFQEAKEIIKWA